MKKNLFFIIIICSLFFTNCKEEKNIPQGAFANGLFIVNEGTFNAGNASISHYNSNTDSLTANIFSSVNSRPLGDVAQSIFVHNDYAYIVVNNSNKIEVVNARTFEEVATIIGLELPRYFYPINDTKAYVTQWGSDGVSGSVQIIDLETFTISGSIQTMGGGPEKIMALNDKIYIGHSGGFGVDEIISIIDPTTDTVINEISVGFNPSDLITDGEGNIWVLCQGYTDWVTYETFNGKLVKLDATNHNVLLDLELSSNYPKDLYISADQNDLYFLFQGAIVQQNINENVLNLNTISNETYFYSLYYSAFENQLYAGDAKDYASEGEVFIYDNSGTLLKKINSGIIPRSFVLQY